MGSRFRIIHIIVIICILVIPGCSFQSQKKTLPIAKKGVLDLRNWDFEKDGSAGLSGEWEFYWQHLVTPEDYISNNHPLMTGYFKFPGAWNNYEVQSKDGKRKIDGSGYATFALTIFHNFSNKQLAFEIKDMSSAYTLFADGKIINSNGIVAKTNAMMTPEFKPGIVHFSPRSNQTQIILHISNFHHRKGGPWRFIRLGDDRSIYEKHTKKSFLNIFIMGSIFIIGLYHLGLFLLRRKVESPLYFGIFCCLVSLRALVTNERYMHLLFPEMGWSVLMKMEYLSFYIAVPVFGMFIFSLFPKESSKRVLHFIHAVAIIFALIVIATPAAVYTHTVQSYQVFTVFASLYIFYILWLAYRKNREGIRIISIGFIALFLFIFYDILQANEYVQTEPLLPVGMFIFIFSQSFLLSLRFSKALSRIEKQKSRLIKINRAVKKEINEKKRLEVNLEKSDEQFKNSRIALILGLAKLSEYRDEDTGRHLERIREYTKVLAKELSKQPSYREYITDDYISDIYQSAILHDIGKVGIKDSILLKPGKLTQDEFEMIKDHPSIGGDAIASIESQMKMRSFLTLAKDIAYCHHEKWDGSGYPKGLKEKEIPLSARITAVADVYDALTSERPYKEAFSHEKAVEIIINDSGTHFDPNIIETFRIKADQFEKIRKNILE
jgi:response regulator RpfG family c-di-GMP phosphodiesterase